MAMSVRGTSEGATGTRRRVEGGFTLIEMLVVLVIIGIAITMVSLSVAPGPEKQLRSDAERLVNAFMAAQSEARSDGRAIFWIANDSGWHFERRARPNHLSTNRDDDLTRPDTFKKDELLSPQTWRQTPVTLDSRPQMPLIFDNEWIAAPLVLHLQSAGGNLTITRDAAGQYAIQ